MQDTPLPAGYSMLPPGMMANVVTCLEMSARPPLRAARATADFALSPMPRGDLAGYRALFRHVGEDWMWFSRIVMADEKLAAILGHPDVEAFGLLAGGKLSGLLELDFRERDQCELAFFGVARDAIGTGAGRFLMNEAITRAWARPIARMWVHTCTHDHPNALSFYIRSGFTPYQRMVEIHEDPRLKGHQPMTAAAHIPII